MRSKGALVRSVDGKGNIVVDVVWLCVCCYRCLELD